MSFNFPSSPSANQVYTFGTKSWRWNGVGWDAVVLNIDVATLANAQANAAYAQANIATTIAMNTNTQVNLAMAQANAAANTVAIFTNGVLANNKSTIGFNDTSTVYVSSVVTSTGNTNVSFAANATTLGIPAINSAFATTNTTFGTVNTQITIAQNTAAVYANGTLTLANANINFNNTSTVNVSTSANGTSQANVSFAVNTAAITSAAAGGSNTQVQFNNQGALAGSSNLVFNLTTNTITILGANATTLNTTTINSTSYLTSAGLDVVGQANNAYAKANSAANNVAVYANGTLTLANANVNFNNTSTINVSVTANGTGQVNVAFTSNVSFGGAGGNVTITNETSSGSTFYPSLSTITAGNTTSFNVSSTKLTFIPSTGTLGATVFNSLSDANQKTDITQIESGLYYIRKINGYEFNMLEGGQHSSGVIAQQLEEVLPFLVSVDRNGIRSVNYDGLMGFLIEAIKELSEEVEKLKTI